VTAKPKAIIADGDLAIDCDDGCRCSTPRRAAHWIVVIGYQFDCGACILLLCPQCCAALLQSVAKVIERHGVKLTDVVHVDYLIQGARILHPA
jgi:hypothetical protein